MPLPKLIPASIDDYSTIQNMARFYVYDMSRYCGNLLGWECPPNGLYECFDLKHHFEEKDNHPFFIKMGDELAGFVIINNQGTSDEVDWNMAQFFVLAKFQNRGVGSKVAHTLFLQFQGVWEVSAIPDNKSAEAFWEKTILAHVGEGQCVSKAHKTIKEPEPHPMIVWRFET